MIQTVPMVKPDQKPGLPRTADVHPEEVENWKKTGWVEAENADPIQPEQKKPGRKKRNSA